MLSKQHTVKVADLAVGMYVLKLDIPWIESPLLRHAFKLKNSQQLAKLRQCGARLAIVDLEKSDPAAITSLVPLSTAPAVTGSQSSSEPHRIPPTPLLVAAPQTASLDSPAAALHREIKAGKKIHSQVTALTKRLFDALCDGGGLADEDIEQIEGLASETLASLGRNDQALMTLMHMQRKDTGLYEHAFSVFSLSLALAQAMNLSLQQVHALFFAALFHDIGWLKLPLQLLGTGRAYTDTERKLAEKHTVLGLALLAGANIPEQSLALITQVHRYMADKSPADDAATSAEAEFHKTLQILQVVDRYDELVHQLLDRPGVVPHEALAILNRECHAGSISEQVVRLLVQMLGVYPVSSVLLLNTGEKARVLASNRQHPAQPLIAIFYDARGQLMPERLVVDLAAQNSELVLRKIERVLDPCARGVDPADVLVVDY